MREGESERIEESFKEYDVGIANSWIPYYNKVSLSLFVLHDGESSSIKQEMKQVVSRRRKESGSRDVIMMK